MIYDKNRPLFKAPGVKEIRAGKRRKTADRYNARTIDDLYHDEYLEIPSVFDIVPDIYRNARSFLKKGPHLNIPVPDTMEKCREEKKGIMTRVRERMDSISGMQRKYRGYGWSELDSGQHKLFTLTDIIAGLEIFAAARTCLISEDIRVQDYGRECAVYVPSRSGGEPHLIALKQIPTSESDNVYADGINVKMQGDSVDEVFHGTLNKKYSQGERRVSPHSVAAYFEMARQKLSKKKPRVRQNPIPVPKWSLLQFNDKLSNNVIKRRFAEGRADTLSETEREIMLWSYVQDKGADRCFWFDEGALMAGRAMRHAVRYAEEIREQ